MYKRIFDIENRIDEGMFLFGARQVGKSTLLRERFPDAVYYDLLITNVRKSFKRNPDSFREALLDKPAGTLVIVDEIQKVPELLDSVHWLMVNKGLWFVLSGSSSRKLKRSGANTLGADEYVAKFAFVTQSLVALIQSAERATREMRTSSICPGKAYAFDHPPMWSGPLPANTGSVPNEDVDVYVPPPPTYAR